MSRRDFLLWVSIFIPLAFLQAQDNLVSVHRSIRIMGIPVEITLVNINEEIGYINIEEAAAEIKRIEKLISSWDEESETARINRNAGIKPVAVSDELYHLIERSVQISELTEGAFDISCATLETVWKFDGSMDSFPTEDEVAAVKKISGYKKIILDPATRSVFLKNKGMKISFGAIGKGYAADKAKELLISHQVPAGMINIAGDITAWGTKATGEKWLIGIANPIGMGNLLTWIPLVESSVAISGNNEKYITYKGKKYSDLLDPRTGYPANRISKVTVFSKRAELCDALATAIHVLGTQRGLEIINQLGGTEAVIEDSEGQLSMSKGLLQQAH